MRLLSLCVLTLLSLLLASCYGSKPPSWFISQEGAGGGGKSGARFYGVGSGESLEAAKQAAIDDLAQSIATQVQSSTQIHNSQQDNLLSTQFSQQITLQSAKLSLHNLQVLNKSYTGGKYYLQVGISREQILTPISRELQALLSRSKQRERLSPACLSLGDFAELESQLQEARPLAGILEALAAPLPSEYRSLLSLYEASAPKPKLRLQVLPPPSSSDTPPPALIESSLSAEVAKLAQITRSRPAPLLRLEITGGKSGGGFLLRVVATMLDCAGSPIWQADIQEVQASKDYALKRASIVLYKKLKALREGDEGFPRF